MQIIEQTAQYYRVQLPSGQVLTIARTPGTDALVQSRSAMAGPAPQQAAPAGLPTGGVVPPIQPDAVSTFLQGLQPQPPVVIAPPPVPQPIVPPQVMAQAQPVGVAPLTPAESAGMGAFLGTETGPPMAGPAPTLGGQDPLRKIREEQAQAAMTHTPESIQATIAEDEGSTAGGPELDADLAALMEPQWLPGEQTAGGPTAADLSELNRATTTLAETQAKEQETLAAHYESMRLPEQPPNQPVNPGQFYERVGQMFGAQNPRSARIIGGIASGLMVGLGEFGAALSHRQNVAAGIIQNAISESIAAQENAQALTRQQWLDQTAYATAMSNRKILELAAKAKAPEIQAQAAVMVAKNNLAHLGARVKDGSLTAKEAGPLMKIEKARAAIAPFASKVGTTPAGPGAAIREKMGGFPIVGDLIGPDPAADEAIADRDAANVAFLVGMEPNSDRPVDMNQGFKRYGNVLFQPGDYGETLVWKAKKQLMLLRSSEAIYGRGVRGTDPKGAGTVTPGARPN